ncbi:AraC family transcriptional regulator [Erythrobacter sp. HKB08]|uniref:helix-turn-helix domain-containing protein n=1 Tax=Erythrobacter sp. HKB08 TaxID=2502843 RepID=UPI00100896DC|nr:AraC family transcriptional regulator [Erythrobacter sp. HKB08]
MTASCELEVRFHDLPADLDPYFTTFCYGVVTVHDGDVVHDAMQPEWGTLRFFPQAQPTIFVDGHEAIGGAGFVASGPTSSQLEYTLGTTTFWGVGLLPLGWATFIDFPADSMANTVVDGMADERFAGFRELGKKLLAANLDEEAEKEVIIDFFRHRAKRHPVDAERIVRIHRSLLAEDLPDVATLAQMCDLNQRTLARLCRRAFGFPPKLLLRRQRFMRTLAAYMLEDKATWSEMIDELYYDQPQFVRECREFLGVTPSEYAATKRPILDAFIRERLRHLGVPVQTLQAPAS